MHRNMRRANGWKSDKFKPENKWKFFIINYWEGLVKRYSTLITASSLSVHYLCLLKSCEITEMQIKGQELWIVLWLVLLNEFEWEFTFFSPHLRMTVHLVVCCRVKADLYLLNCHPGLINGWICSLLCFPFYHSNLLDFRAGCVEILFRNFQRSLLFYSEVILRI